MMNRTTAFLVLALVLVAGCSRSESSLPPESGTSLIDGLGRVVTLDGPVRRVVTIAPGATEIVYSAGGMEYLVGVSNVDSYPPHALTLPQFSVLPLDIETVAMLDPDLVIASSQVNDPKEAEVFTALGIPIFYLDSASWDAVQHSILVVGALLGTEHKARAAVNSLTARVESLREITQAIEHKPDGVFLISDVTSYSFGPGSYVMDLFEWAGIRSATGSFDTAAPILDDEFMLARNPDVILGSFGSEYDPVSILDHHPSWRTLSAFKQGRIYSVESDLILRPGPRNVEAAYEIARLVHGDLFEEH